MRYGFLSLCGYSIIITIKVNRECDARNDAKFNNEILDPNILLSLHQGQLYT